MSESTRKKKLKVPHTYVIIFCIVILAFIGTYFIPAGTYERVQDPNSGRTVVDPDSYHQVEQTPVKFFAFDGPHLFTSVHQGMQAASSIIFFILIVGGAFSMIQGTGAIDAGIGKAVLAMKDKGELIIPVLIVIFGFGGATIGMAEETIVFVPIGIALARALGYDTIVGVAMITLGAAAGFSSGFANPFTVGVAQSIAEVPIYSAMGFRIAIFVVMIAVTTWYILRYAHKVKRNPELSVVADLERESSEHHLDLSAIPKLTGKHYAVYAVIVAGFAIMIYGIREYGWYIQELASIFLMMGIFASLAGGVGPSKTASHFVEGAKGIAFGALVVGIARAILVVMESGQIIDTIIHGMATGISSLPSMLAALLMYVVQIIINFFIPSGSGQAATTMPIMAPLGDLVGVTRQTAVLAYQFGDGFTNSIIPTSAVLMSYLAIAKVPYEKWFKWILPLMGIWIVVGAVFLMIAQAIGLQ